MRRATVFTLTLVLGALFPAAARAADPERVEWSDDWPRVRAWEVADAFALTVADTEFEEHVPISQTRWRGGILFDDWARSVFRGRTAAVQSAASSVSDGFFYAGTLVPFVVDSFFFSLDVHHSADVAVQLFVIDLQAEGMSGIVSLAAEHGVGRARPYTTNCVDGADRDASGAFLHACGIPNDSRSFFSGHTAAVTTAAGLVCVEHQHLPLFGGGFADLAPCLLMMSVSAAAGVLRLVYDEHWASDVIVGWAVGAASGYVLPSLLHYGFGAGAPEIHAAGATLIPTLGTFGGAAGLGVVGAF